MKESKEDRNLQLRSLLYLKEVGEYLTDLHTLLPELSGLRFGSSNKNEQFNDIQWATDKEPAE